MTKEKLRLVQLSTTQFEELDALLITDLTDEEIESVVYPMTENDSSVYTNYTLVDALREKFPDRPLTAYDISEVSLLAI